MKIRAIDFLFTISLVIIFAQYIKVISFNYYTQYIISGIWVIYDYSCILLNKGMNTQFNKDIKFARFIYLIPWIIIAIHTILLCCLGNNINVPITTMLISNITIIINVLFAFSAINIMKEKALYYSIIALIIIFTITTTRAVYLKGPLVAFEVLREIFGTLDSHSNPFEISDCTFASGLVFLVYLFYGKKKSTKEKVVLFFCALFILLGFKRIQMLALAVVVFIGLFLNIIKSKKIKKLFMFIISVAIISYAVAFLITIDDDKKIANWQGLDMGRKHLYSFMNDYYSFDLSYLGHGYGFSNKFIELNTTFSITVLHSDILRMYVELGFIGFFIWIIYYFFVARKHIEKKYNIDIACKFFFMTVYLMILHFTDNTVNYFVTQYFYCILLPMFVIGNKLFENKKIEDKNG